MKKILIVEDEAITALSFKTFLEGKGYDCYVFYSGEDALQKIETEKFDLAVQIKR